MRSPGAGERAVLPVGLPNVVMAAALLQSQDLVQRLSRGGQSSLLPVRHPDTITCRRWTPVSQNSGHSFKHSAELYNKHVSDRTYSTVHQGAIQLQTNWTDGDKPDFC